MFQVYTYAEEDWAKRSSEHPTEEEAKAYAQKEKWDIYWIKKLNFELCIYDEDGEVEYSGGFETEKEVEEFIKNKVENREVMPEYEIKRLL
ncbi:hypothetical protein U8V72_20905 [Priestia filamentosa]|uniref:hypothetical protein n=1 Tax=Priestia filamentosa TaxID=1402861 RepID=UPI00397D0543